MSTQGVSFNGQTWPRLVRGVKAFAASEVGWKAKMLAASLVGLLFAINGLNVLNSYVGRDFVTAIENRDMGGFAWHGVLYVAVFAVITVAAVFYRFAEERLGLLWREWLTRRLVDLYLDQRTYYRLDAAGEIENPDQRISEDVRAFTVTTLSFTLMLLNASFTVVAFSGVLWSISPVLFLVAVLYAVGGSYLTVRLGRRLVDLNFRQLDKEANFRADLIHVRENAESVALLHREERMKSRLLRHLDDLVANFRRMIQVNRNLGFFTTGYNYMIQVIPALIVGPLFIQGQVEFGVITQSAMAFAQIAGAFSLVVTNFQSISAFTAVISRLGSLGEAIEAVRSPAVPAATVPFCDICLTPSVEQERPAAIEVEERDSAVAFEGLTLVSPRDGRPLITELSISIPYGTNVLILGPDDEAKVALFRATAGIWESGSGRILRPPFGDIYFLPERPYMPPGTLRELLVRTGLEASITEERILEMLRTLDLMPVLDRTGGFDVERDWDDILSLSEQQRLAFARLFLAEPPPRFAFLDRVRTALGPEDVRHMLAMLARHGITYITLGRSTHGRREVDDKLEDYNAVLELTGDGGWNWTPARPGKTPS